VALQARGDLLVLRAPADEVFVEAVDGDEILAPEGLVAAFDGDEGVREAAHGAAQTRRVQGVSAAANAEARRRGRRNRAE
jgi:hypothetical protein